MSDAFPTQAALARHLDALGLFHMDLSLTRMRTILAALDLPRPKAVVQIVGTNGKGSTSVFLESILRAHGVATGLFTSPHLVSPRERIQTFGRFVRGGPWLRAANAVAAASPGAAVPGDPRSLTYFELLTAMAACIFSQSGAAAAIYEAGLGARHDATSALVRDMVLFTPIGADHEHVIGPGIPDIARDKSRAMSPGMAALCSAQTPDVLRILHTRAAEVGVGLQIAPSLPGDLRRAALGLRGSFQAGNASLAVAGFLRLAPRLGLVPDIGLIRKGLARAFIPGRFQFVPGDPGFILDAAHNPQALGVLAGALAHAGLTPSRLVFACMADKDVRAMVPLAAKLTPGEILLPAMPDCPRAMAPKDLAALFGPRSRVAPSLPQALAMRTDAAGPILVCGSLYLLAQFYKHRPRALFPANETVRNKNTCVLDFCSALD